MKLKFNPAFAKTVPFPYQVEDTQKLLDHEAFALFLEMGCGKSKITIDAPCVLATAKQINTVIVVAPSANVLLRMHWAKRFRPKVLWVSGWQVRAVHP